MSKSDGGKGSSPRPFSVSNAEYASRWEAIFGREPRCPRCESAEVDVLTQPAQGIETTYKECRECSLVWGQE